MVHPANSNHPEYNETLDMEVVFVDPDRSGSSTPDTPPETGGDEPEIAKLLTFTVVNNTSPLSVDVLENPDGSLEKYYYGFNADPIWRSTLSYNGDTSRYIAQLWEGWENTNYLQFDFSRKSSYAKLKIVYTFNIITSADISTE